MLCSPDVFPKPGGSGRLFSSSGGSAVFLPFLFKSRALWRKGRLLPGWGPAWPPVCRHLLRASPSHTAPAPARCNAVWNPSSVRTTGSPFPHSTESRKHNMLPRGCRICRTWGALCTARRPPASAGEPRGMQTRKNVATPKMGPSGAVCRADRALGPIWGFCSGRN